MGEDTNRRVVLVALIATLSACVEPIRPPTLAMRFEITRESLNAISSTFRTYATRNRYKFEDVEVGVDRFFSLTNESMRISMGAGGWADAAVTTHHWPYEYQVHFYPTDPSSDLDSLAQEIAMLLSSIDGVRKSGPNFVPDKNDAPGPL